MKVSISMINIINNSTFEVTKETMLIHRVEGWICTRYCVSLIIFISLSATIVLWYVKQSQQVISNNTQVEYESDPPDPNMDSSLVEVENLVPIDKHNLQPHHFSSREVAESLINKLMDRIGNGSGPVICGGIGDSGTRGVRDVLMNLGVQMLEYPYVHPTSKDSEIYMVRLD